MSGRRLFTGIGIALGGTGGALAALIGGPTAPAEPAAPPVVAAPAIAPASIPGATTALPPASAAPSTSTSAPATASATLSASAAASPAAPASAAVPLPEPVPKDIPSTRDALLRAQLYCDQRKDFDECTRAAHAFERGTAGPVDLEQAKRFRKIALTHLVAQCEAGNSPRACFVLAAKYRAGTEVALSPNGAMALEKRALELCRFRRDAECPAP